MRGRACWVVVIFAAILLFAENGCATATRERVPTADAPMVGCYISCPDGFLFRAQHLCRGRRHFEDISITGSEDVAGDPSASRWFTGVTSWGADAIVQKRLAAAGVTKDNPREWSKRYSAELREVENSLGDSSKAAYPKQDVVLTSCDAYIRSLILTKQIEYGVHEGEPDRRKDQ